jgi:hypothetical protein
MFYILNLIKIKLIADGRIHSVRSNSIRPKFKRSLNLIKLPQFSLVCFAFICFFALCSCGIEEPYPFDKTGFTTRRAPYPQAAPKQYPEQPYAAPYYQPNSGANSDPYAQYPQQNYYPYYDYDYHYVPPANYRNVEQNAEPYGASGPEAKQ